MDIITYGNVELINLINNVLDNTEGEFKLSKFISVYNYDRKNLIILFNSFTRKIITLSKDEYKILESGIKAQERNTIVRFLINELMIINDSIDEDQLYDDVRKAFMLENHRKFNGYEIFVIFTTTVCNARCFYCFERNTKYITMDNQTAKQVADYIISSRNPDRPICLHWFGGEPLCNISAIETICACLKQSGVDFTSRFTSNASIFDIDIAEKAVRDWHTDRVQVTLDGTEKEHNKRKNYVNPQKYNFATTVDNIDILANKGVNVTIRINCDVENIDDVDELVDYLCIKFSGYDNIFIDPHPIFNCDNNENISEIDIEFYNKMIFLEEKTSHYNLENNAEVKKNSKNAFEKFRLGSCQSVSMRISPDGKLYPCQHIDQVKSYGNIYDGITDKQAYMRWKEEKHHSRCISCQYRPLCGCLEFCNANRDKCQEYANLKYKKWVIEYCESYYDMFKYVKLVGNFHIHKVLNTVIAIDVSSDSETNVRTVIKMNGISHYMWQLIEKGITKRELVEKILEHYDASSYVAENAVCKFVGYLDLKGLIA